MTTAVGGPRQNFLRTYNQAIRTLIATIRPFDAIESGHQQNALEWIDSDAPLCRTAKPATPLKHLVSYCALLDPDKKSLLLVDHKQALLWLPPGGHVEPAEHPTETAHRELREELGISLPLFHPTPVFLTVTETVGATAGHTDVSLWYLFTADSSASYAYDQAEFNRIRWFPLDDLPLQRTDPHLARFCSKLLISSLLCEPANV